MGSVTKVCAETEDTTEQEYITADGCYTYKILDAEKKTAALTKVDKNKVVCYRSGFAEYPYDSVKGG